MATIFESNELTNEERYKLIKGDAIALSELNEDRTVTVTKYTCNQILDKDAVLSFATDSGEVFATSSKTFIEEFKLVHDCFGYVKTIEIMKKKSKANRGFYTCRAVF